jgi:hypothetical protein
MSYIRIRKRRRGGPKRNYGAETKSQAKSQSPEVAEDLHPPETAPKGATAKPCLDAHSKNYRTIENGFVFAGPI